MSDNQTQQRWKTLATQLGEHYNADVYIYSGRINDETADDFIRLARQPSRENVVLLLASRGGSPDAAFRMARALKRYYKRLVLVVYGRCKSAGTVIALAAHEIVISDFGEFGPLDVQLDKQDELFENVSGLNITQALSSLNTRTFDFFKEALIDLRTKSKGQISTKLAADIATRLALGAYEKIYSQIEPVQLGAMERAISIASDYAERLKSDNVRPGAIDRLVNRYSSHSFVIDLEEAKELFKTVRTPSDIEEELGDCIQHVTRDQAESPFAYKLNDQPQEQIHEVRDEAEEQGAAGAPAGGATNNPPSSPDADVAGATPARPRAVK